MEHAPDIEALRPWLAVDQPDATGEWAGYCPLHEDRNASASFNFTKGVWRCFAGCPDGPIGELIWRLDELDDVVIESTGQTGGFSASVVDLQEARRKRGRGRGQPLPTDAQVEGWHQALLSSTEHLRALSERRGLSLDSVKRWRLGWNTDEGAYTIPMYDIHGSLVNVKHYRLDTEDDAKKMWGVTGHNGARLYPDTILADEDEVFVAEGELDALLLNQFGFPTVTGTGGTNTWKREWNGRFRDKTVYVVYDCDEPGQDGARRVARNLDGVADVVLKIELPFDIVDSGGQDVTDLWLATREEFEREFKDLIRDALLMTEERTNTDATLTSVNVLDSFSAENTGKPLEMRVAVAGRTNAPYLIPKIARYECTRDAGQKCQSCPLNESGMDEMEVKPDDAVVLEMVGSSSKTLHEIIRRHVGATKCDRARWMSVESQNVEELFVRPALDEMDEEVEEDYAHTRKVYSVGRHNTMPNTTVKVRGHVLPNPGDQRTEFLAWTVDPTESNIDKFQTTPELHERLKAFQPSPDQKPLNKLAEIARDLSGNVTQIYGRLDIHMAMDLVWHSALKFRFADRLVRKGWLEIILYGDTRTGKSEAATKLAQHYRAGRIVSCESSSYAGIVGGLQQYGGKEWSITWGAIPLNDRRLVVLDEVSGMSTDEIAHMSSIRSSGVAELTKIQQERTSARTRLIWIGNPRSGPMGQYLHGVHALPELIGNPEDIARFDLAVAVAGGDVKSSEINRPDRDSVDHVFTSDLCRDMVMWAWSRKAGHFRWESGAEREVFKKADEMGGKYVESPPLIQAANVREKIARFAVALAVRTYSTDDGEHVMVTKRHVRDAVKFMNVIYGKDASGYRDVSRKRIEEKRVAEQSKRKCRKYLEATPRLARFLRGRVGHFRRQDLEEMLNVSREEANAIIARLWDWRMVSKDEQGNIRAEPELNDLIKSMEEEK